MARTAVPKLTLTADLHPGYRLRQLRGSGGFGEVWEAETATGATVALKFLPTGKTHQGAAQELRSIQLVQNLIHPHLVRIDRVWCAAGFLVIAMELADGSLADLLDVYLADLGAPLPPDHLLPFMAQAAQALDFLNNRQHLLHGQWVTIQHCDVTPSNLLIFDHTVKLSDFGLTTTLAARQKVHLRAGTPSYAAPEVFKGRLSDRTDQYALAVCYCLLRGGRQPFADSPPDFSTDYIRPAPDLSMLEPAERPAIERALAPIEQDRWPACGALIAELQKRMSLQPAVAQPSEARREPRYQPARTVGCEVLATLGNQAWAAQVQNLSMGGARLRLTRPGCDMRAGRVLELVLSNGASGFWKSARLRLAHSAALPGGDYEVGGAFVEPLSQGELTALSE